MENNHQQHDHGHHGKMKTKRNLKHLGNVIEIETTYEIKINGENYNTHVMLGEDGALTTHAIPYMTFKSMTDLIKTLIELYPNEFKNHQNHHHHDS